MKLSQQNIRIGTSNIVIPGSRDSFPAPYNLKSRLHYYAFFFDTVEINQTFYKLPRAATFERWAGEVGDAFQFTLKLSRDITHFKHLKGDLAFLDNFLYAADTLKEKKGCLLLQFPGKITLEYFNEVEAILQKATSADEHSQWKVAVELRHLSWHTGETYELLNSFGATLVMQDKPASKMMEQVTNAPLVYMRLHGPLGDYRGSYTDEFLKQQADRIIQLAAEGKTVYLYFNNTIGNAFNNAITLTGMIYSDYS